MLRYMLVVFSLGLFQNLFAVEKDPVVAEINGTKITKSFFQQTYEESRKFVSEQRVTKEKVLNDLINRELGIQRAKENKIETDPDVRTKIEDVMYHAQISKDLENELKKIEVSDQDVKNYYEDHKEYRTAHILFRLRANPSKNEMEEAIKQALRVYKELQKEPSKFPELANKYSQSSTAPNGGDMGFQPAVSLAPEYFEAIKGKKPDYISSPVRTQFGYHLIKVIAVKDFKAINLPLYQKIVYDTKRDKILADYFANLRKNASIQVYQQNLD